MEEEHPFIKHHSKPIYSFSYGKILSLLLILFVLFLLLSASAVSIGLLVHYFARAERNEASTAPITLEDLSNSSFSVKHFSGEWSSDGHQLFSVTEQGLEKLDASANTSTVLMTRTEWDSLSADKWRVSPSLSHILLARNLNKVYRHSYTADYSLLRLSGKEISPVPGSQWRVVQWAGTESLVLANATGLYFSKDTNSSVSLLRAATGGELTGYPDWVYEEEVLASNSAVWSSDSSAPMLAFLVFNSTGVTEATITRYGEEIGPYPSYQRIPYPKPGDRESSVQLHLINTTDSKTCQIMLPTGSHYIEHVEWIEEELVVRVLNKEQTNVSLLLYATDCTEVRTLNTYQTEGWIESTLLDYWFLANGARLVLIPMKQAGNTSMQIVKIDGSTSTQLTRNQEVRLMLGVHNSERVFYASGEHSYLTNLYSISISDPSDLVCVNCLLRDKLGGLGLGERECEVVSASFSDSVEYFILNCLGPDIPFSLLLDSSLNILRVLEDNSALSDTLSSVSLPSIQPFHFSDESFTFYGTRMVPGDFSESQPHPVLLYVYGGPNSQLASLSHPLIPFSGYIAHLVSALGFVVITVEGRGTCCRGQEFRFLVKDRLGVLEAQDQLSLAGFLLAQGWVHSVSVMGASYGGYLSGMVLAGGSSLLAAGIVISPVTDWRYYDSIYTQRYMQTPQTNLQGYNESSLLLRAEKIDGEKLLLIHGSADDNVHYQNSAELSLALKRSGQQFRMHTYFNENHSLRHEGTRAHLYQLLDSFLREKVLSV